MAKSSYDKAYTQELNEPVFRRRIDVNRQAQRVQANPYAPSAINYHGEERKRDSNKRWNQNHDTQDRFLGKMQRQACMVDVLLKNDSLRSGRIESYDNWSILLEYEGKKSLLFKSSVMAVTETESEKEVAYQRGQVMSEFLADYESTQLS